MYVVVRSYSGDEGSALLGALEQHEAEVRELVSSVPGFVSYVAFRSGDGAATVTICQDKEGTDESIRRAADWVKQNLGGQVGSPTITEGRASLQF